MTAAREVTIDGELLAVSRSYRRRLIGTPAIYVTANGAVPLRPSTRSVCRPPSR